LRRIDDDTEIVPVMMMNIAHGRIATDPEKSKSIPPV